MYSMILRESPTEDFMANPNLINKQAANVAYAGTSYEPEKRGELAIQGFADEVNSMYERLKPYAKSEAQKATLISEMERFQASYAQKYNDLLYSHSRLYSTMIAGPSKFPVERMRKLNEAYDKKADETREWKDRAERAILRILKGEAIEEAGGEIEVLKKKIADAERNHEFMVKTNVIVRKKIPDDQKIREIMALGPISESTAREILKPDFMGRIGFPAYSLSNDLANIARMKERVKELEKKETTPTGEIPFIGGKIIDNKEADRIQIIFDQKPQQETINKLKSEGWRWSPSNMAWQRKRTDNALYSARRILGLEQKGPVFVPVKGQLAAPPVPVAKPAKYKLGQMVYSYQNPTIAAPIIAIHLSDDPQYAHTYILRIPSSTGEGTKNSNNIDENSISEIPISSAPITEKPPPKPINIEAIDIEAILRKYFKDYNWLSLQAMLEQSEEYIANELTHQIKGLSEGDALRITSQMKAYVAAKIKEIERQYEEKKEKEYAERDRIEKEKKQKLWNEVKDLKIADVQVEFSPVEKDRYYRWMYLNTLAILENGKRVMIRREQFKGSDIKDVHKLGPSHFRKFELKYIGMPVNEAITEDHFGKYNNFEEYMKQAPVPVQQRWFEEAQKEEEMKLYRYYYSHRPPDIGTQPEGFTNHEAWLPAKLTPLGNRAFGWVEYSRPLTPDELYRFELFEDVIVMPKLVQDLVKFAHDENVDEAMKAVAPGGRYYKAMSDWMKANKTWHMDVDPLSNIRNELIKLGGKITKEETPEKQRVIVPPPKAPLPIPAAPAVKAGKPPEELQRDIVFRIQDAKTIDELQEIQRELPFLPLPPDEKNKINQQLQRRKVAIQGELPFGVRVAPKPQLKSVVIGAPTPQQQFEAERRQRAEREKKARGQKTLPLTSRRLFEFGVKERMARYALI